jgi:hypothetical protein
VLELLFSLSSVGVGAAAVSSLVEVPITIISCVEDAPSTATMSRVEGGSAAVVCSGAVSDVVAAPTMLVLAGPGAPVNPGVQQGMYEAV